MNKQIHILVLCLLLIACNIFTKPYKKEIKIASKEDLLSYIGKNWTKHNNCNCYYYDITNNNLLTPVGKYWHKGSLLRVIDKQQGWFKGMTKLEIKEIFGEPSFNIPANEKEEYFFMYYIKQDEQWCCRDIESDYQYHFIYSPSLAIKVFFNDIGLVTHMFVSDDPTF